MNATAKVVASKIERKLEQYEKKKKKKRTVPVEIVPGAQVKRGDCLRPQQQQRRFAEAMLIRFNLI